MRLGETAPAQDWILNLNTQGQTQDLVLSTPSFPHLFGSQDSPLQALVAQPGPLSLGAPWYYQHPPLQMSIRTNSLLGEREW